MAREISASLAVCRCRGCVKLFSYNERIVGHDSRRIAVSRLQLEFESAGYKPNVSLRYSNRAIPVTPSAPENCPSLIPSVDFSKDGGETRASHPEWLGRRHN